MTHTDEIPTPRPLGELVYVSFKIYALIAGRNVTFVRLVARRKT
jgi:hypothetical protein